MISSKKLTALVAVLMAIAVALTGTLIALAHTVDSVSVSASTSLGYASSLFDKNSIMNVDISVDQEAWAQMLENAINEEYISCDITVNGTTYASVGIRPKGNSSLTTMASSDSDRFSFKVEFDHYVKGQTCEGLDKLVLNNTDSDATYMKEYLSYDMMSFMGVTSSLYSFANITVNGEAWGCYLALEGVEESFALRNYGSSYGEIYKPEGNEMGGGGKEMQQGDFPDLGGGFPGGQQDEGEDANQPANDPDSGASSSDAQQGVSPGGNANQQGGPPGMTQPPGQNNAQTDGENASPNGGQQLQGGFPGGQQPSTQDGQQAPAQGGQQPPTQGGQQPSTQDGQQAPAQGGQQPSTQDGQQNPAQGGQQIPSDGNATQPEDGNSGNAPQFPTDGQDGAFTPPDMEGGGMGGGFPGSSSGGGSDLVYVDDNSQSYSDIFDNAVFDADESDYQRVITALEALNAGANLERYVDVDQVLRYFAVNTVLVNLDSYVSSMKHNYYLYENNGQISILPWDFNLAFAGFQSNSAESAVNLPIDTPVQGVDLSERPLLGKLLEVDEYSQLYHAYLQQIVSEYFDSGVFEQTIHSLDSLIASSVENDPTALFTYDEYTTAVETLIEFGTLRAQSIQGQLDGTIPSTTEGQQQDPDALVDADGLSITAMGTQGGGGGMGGGMGPGGQGGAAEGGQADAQQPNDNQAGSPSEMPDRETMQKAMSILGDSDAASLTEEQREQLNALGITDEMIEQFQNRSMPAMQNAGQPGGQGRSPFQSSAARQGSAVSTASVIVLAGCLAAAMAGVVLLLLIPRRRLQKPR